MKFITKNSSHSTVHIGMQEKCVEETVNTKFLGLQIDNHIKWKNYIDMIPELTLSLLMSCIYMELLVKPEILTLYIYIYIYGPTFGNAESPLFLFAAQCFNTESMQSNFLCHICV